MMDTKNIEDLCRICVNESHSFKNIYDQYVLDVRLFDIINDLCQLDVCPGDELPEYVCLQCHSQLLEFHKFKQMSHEGKTALLSIKMKIDKVYIKEEPPDITDDRVISARPYVSMEEAAGDHSDRDAEEILPDRGTPSCVQEAATVDDTLILDNQVFIKCEPVDTNCESDSALHSTLELGGDVGSVNSQVFIKCEPVDSNFETDAALDSKLEVGSDINSFNPQALLKIEQVHANYIEDMDVAPSLQSSLESDRFHPEGHWSGLDSVNDGRVSTGLSVEEAETSRKGFLKASQMSRRVLAKVCRRARGYAQRRRPFGTSRENPEARQIRLEAQRHKARRRRQLESPAACEQRLEKQRERQKRRLERETKEQREARLQNLRLNKAAHIASETPDQKVDRLWKMRLSQSKRLAKEKKEQREERLLRLMLNQVNRREKLMGAQEDREGRLNETSCSTKLIPQYGEDLMGVPEGNLATFQQLQCPEDKANVPGMCLLEPKTRRRSSTGTPQYKEELLGVPVDALATLEEILGPEGKFEASVERKRRLKLRIRKGSKVIQLQETEEPDLVDPVDQSGSPCEGNVPETLNSEMESEIVSEPVRDYCQLQENLPEPRERNGSPLVSHKLQKDIGGQNEESEPTKCSLRPNLSDLSPQDITQQEENQVQASNHKLSGTKDLSGVVVGCPGQEELPSLPSKRRGSAKGRPQYNEDLLGVTEEHLADQEDTLAADDKTSRPRRVRSKLTDDNADNHRRRSQPKRKVCELVNYVENADYHDKDEGDISDTNENQTVGQPGGSLAQERDKCSQKSMRAKWSCDTEEKNQLSENLALDISGDPVHIPDVQDGVILPEGDYQDNSGHSVPDMRDTIGVSFPKHGEIEADQPNKMGAKNPCIPIKRAGKEQNSAIVRDEEMYTQHSSSQKAQINVADRSQKNQNMQKTMKMPKRSHNSTKLIDMALKEDMSQSTGTAVNSSAPVEVDTSCSHFLSPSKIASLKLKPSSCIVPVAQTSRASANLPTLVDDAACSRQLQLTTVKSIKLKKSYKDLPPQVQKVKNGECYLSQTCPQPAADSEVTENPVLEAERQGEEVGTLDAQMVQRRPSTGDIEEFFATSSSTSSIKDDSELSSTSRDGLNLPIVPTSADCCLLQNVSNQLGITENDSVSSLTETNMRWRTHSGRRKQKFLHPGETSAVSVNDEDLDTRLVLKEPSCSTNSFQKQCVVDGGGVVVVNADTS